MADLQEPLDQTCIMCPRRGTKVCPKCKDAVYCSKDCQALDWKLHKSLCRTFSSLPEQGPDHVRAVLFHQFNSVPKFAYLATGYLDGQTDQQAITLTPFVLHDDCEAIAIRINHIQSRAIEREPGKMLKVIYPGRLSERSIFHLENEPLGRATRIGHAPARGNIIGTRMVRDVTNNMMVYADVDMRDARNIVDNIGSKRRGLPVSSLRTATALGTLVSCLPNVQAGKDQFRSVIVTTDNVIYGSGLGVNISNLLGIPILTTRFNDQHDEHSDKYSDEHSDEHSDDSPKINLNMAMLSCDINSTSITPKPSAEARSKPNPHSPEAVRDIVCGVSGFGSPLNLWVGPCGDGLAFRADGKPFPKEDAEALIGYVKDEVAPKIMDALLALGPNNIVTQRQEVLDFITKHNFETYFTNMKAKKVSQGRSEWDGLPSPYDITPAHYGDLPKMEDTRYGIREL